VIVSAVMLVVAFGAALYFGGVSCAGETRGQKRPREWSPNARLSSGAACASEAWRRSVRISTAQAHRSDPSVEREPGRADTVSCV